MEKQEIQVESYKPMLTVENAIAWDFAIRAVNLLETYAEHQIKLKTYAVQDDYYKKEMATFENDEFEITVSLRKK